MKHIINNLTIYLSTITGAVMQALREFDYLPVIISTAIAAIIGFSVHNTLKFIHNKIIIKMWPGLDFENRNRKK